MSRPPTRSVLPLRRPEPSYERRGRRSRQLIAIPVVVLFVLPVWFMVVGSLRPLGLPPPTSVQWFPSSAAWSNYAEVFDVVPFARYSANSLLVAAVAVPLSVLVASWAGFAIARTSPRSRVFLIAVCIVVLMIPATSLLVGRVSVFRWLGLTDTPIPLMANALLGMSPAFVLLYAWAFWRLSEDLFDLATEAGLSPVRTWWVVAMPLVRPITGAVAAIAFLLSWGNFLDPLIYVYDERWFTLPLGMRSLSTLPAPEQPVMLAGAVLACIPVAIVFVSVQRRLFRGGLNEEGS